MKHLVLFFALFSGLLFSQEVPKTPPIVNIEKIYKPMVPTKDQLAKVDAIDKKAGDQKKRLQTIAWEWQKKLHLDDYDVALEMDDINNMKPGALGASLILKEYPFVILIGVLDAGNYALVDDYANQLGLKDRAPGRPKELPTTVRAITKDQEQTVIHELVHVALAMAGTPREEEQVKALTAALVGHPIKNWK